MNAIELIQQLERIVAEHGPAIRLEVRNEAGDWDYLEHVGVTLGGSGESVVALDVGGPTQDYDRGDGIFLGG